MGNRIYQVYNIIFFTNTVIPLVKVEYQLKGCFFANISKFHVIDSSDFV